MGWPAELVRWPAPEAWEAGLRAGREFARKAPAPQQPAPATADKPDPAEVVSLADLRPLRDEIRRTGWQAKPGEPADKPILDMLRADYPGRLPPEATLRDITKPMLARALA